MIAASIPDIDGLGFFFGEEWFWRFHHVVGHNVFYGLIVAMALTIGSRSRRIVFPAYVALFHIHLLIDYFGSGPGWQIYYLWPLSHRGWKTSMVWDLQSWQNRVTLGVLLGITILIAWRKKRTPLELLAPRLDAWLVRRRRA